MGREQGADEADVTADLPPSSELRGSPLQVLSTLLSDFEQRDTVLEIVQQLVARNSELEQRLARIASRFKKSEKVSKAQLVLFIDALRRGEGEPEVSGDEEHDELGEADATLREASGIDSASEDEELDKLKTRRPPRQPHGRTEAPAHLRRIDVRPVRHHHRARTPQRRRRFAPRSARQQSRRARPRFGRDEHDVDVARQATMLKTVVEDRDSRARRCRCMRACCTVASDVHRHIRIPLPVQHRLILRVAAVQQRRPVPELHQTSREKCRERCLPCTANREVADADDRDRGMHHAAEPA